MSQGSTRKRCALVAAAADHRPTLHDTNCKKPRGNGAPGGHLTYCSQLFALVRFLLLNRNSCETHVPHLFVDVRPQSRQSEGTHRGANCRSSLLFLLRMRSPAGTPMATVCTCSLNHQGRGLGCCGCRLMADDATSGWDLSTCRHAGRGGGSRRRLSYPSSSAKFLPWRRPATKRPCLGLLRSRDWIQSLSGTESAIASQSSVRRPRRRIWP